MTSASRIPLQLELLSKHDSNFVRRIREPFNASCFDLDRSPKGNSLTEGNLAWMIASDQRRTSKRRKVSRADTRARARALLDCGKVGENHPMPRRRRDGEKASQIPPGGREVRHQRKCKVVAEVRRQVDISTTRVRGDRKL
jgi:hypothetical protein